MPKYQKFEDLPAWQEAAQLYEAVLEVVEGPNVPWTATFRNQLERAALATSNQIADGFERATRDDLLCLLRDARSSAVDVRSMLAVIVRRTKTKPIQPAVEKIRGLADSCARQIGAWIRAVESPRSEPGSAGAGNSEGADARREGATSPATNRPNVAEQTRRR
ncbi:MAG: four helix bundle protein [Verrucomicrobiales bacterium]|nr:four helix bundle protein [Verrucomicrobiales bacterium]